MDDKDSIEERCKLFWKVEFGVKDLYWVAKAVF